MDDDDGLIIAPANGVIFVAKAARLLQDIVITFSSIDAQTRICIVSSIGDLQLIRFLLLSLWNLLKGKQYPICSNSRPVG